MVCAGAGVRYLLPHRQPLNGFLSFYPTKAMTVQQSQDQDLQDQSDNEDQANTVDPDLEGLDELDDHTSQEESEDSEDDGEQGKQEQTVEIDGEQVPLSEVKKWKAGNMRTDDYTRKTQELAEEKRRLARGQRTLKSSITTDKVANDPAAKQALEALKSLGFMTQDEVDDRLSTFQQGQQEERALSSIIARNPRLKPYEKAIREIGKNSGAAWEDIITNYGFSQKTALIRAKGSRQIVGNPPAKKAAAEKEVSDMTDAELEAWEKRNLTGRRYVKQAK